MANPYLGEIRIFSGSFAPVNWALCNGQLLPIAQNAALFAVIGTFYGGDGVSTFGLPDLRGRCPVHQGQGPGLSPYVVGQQSGMERVTLTINHMPIHNHQVNCNTGTPTVPSPANNFISGGANPSAKVFQTSSNATMAQGMIQPAGGSQPVSILQPLLCVTFIIALAGIFPTRS